MYGGEKRCNLKEKDHLEDLGLNGRIIQSGLSKIVWGKRELD
jgi:hypothetical protein